MRALGSWSVRLLGRAGLSFACFSAGASWQAPAEACVTASMGATGPEPAWVALGERELPQHPLSLDLGRCTRLTLFGSARMRVERVPELHHAAPPVSQPQVVGEPRAASWVPEPLVRVGASFDSGRRFGSFVLSALYEHELVSGLSGHTVAPEQGGYPREVRSTDVGAEPRRAYGRFAFGSLVGLQLGMDTSHFGLGLVENDGAHDPAPGDASFADPRGGDRVLEARLFTGPLGDVGFSSYVALQNTRGRFGEGGVRLLGGARLGRDDIDWLGVQLSSQGLNVDEISAAGVDAPSGSHHHRLGVAGSYALDFGAELLLLEAELARQWGARGPDGRALSVHGAVGRATLSAGRLTVGLTALFASGDSEPTSGEYTAFAANPNFDQGLLLFRRVQAVQSAGQTTSQGVVGIRGRETGGGASNAFTLFPRIGYRLTTGLDAYAGVLFAFAAKEPVAPDAPRRGPSGAEPGGYWGTEYDVGARLRVLAWGSLLTLGAEAGVLDPGSALEGSPAVPGAGEVAALMRGFANFDW